MKFWTETRTAMILARLGTVRAAAAELGVHRATVTRHIDALEEHLGVKLFLRHADGYTVTADGEALVAFAEAADQLIEGFVAETTQQANGISGSITVSAFLRAAPIITPAIGSFVSDHPNVRVRMIADNGLTELETGQAHVAIRTGPKPTNPDYVVIPFKTVPIGLYGHPDYFANHGFPTSQEDLRNHRFIGIERADGSVDLSESFAVRDENFAMVTNDPTVVLDAVLAGLGLGMVAEFDAANHPELRRVAIDHPQLFAEVWIVTHVDLHRTQLLQTFLSYLR
ncbi:MAG: LysR family transcriptional regulator [Pseudomonadota bacterium]